MANTGIGVQSEYVLHQTLKRYVEPNESYHEQPCGAFVADVLRDGHIYEIQTKDFFRLRHKLAYYLEAGYQVTVVYPVFARRYLRWVDPASGELSERRRISRAGTLQDVFAELYRIRDLFGHAGLSLRVLELEVEEYKLQDGYGAERKKKATRIERVLKEVLSQVSIEKTADLRQLIPPNATFPLTVKAYAKLAKCRPAVAGAALRMLTLYGITERVGKVGREYLYELIPCGIAQTDTADIAQNTH